jgi:putative oxidoreductase
MANFLDFLGRVFISSIFLLSAYNKIFNYNGTISWMEGFRIPGFLLAPAIVLEIILPLLIIIGYRTKLAASLLAIFCIVTGVIFHLDFSDQMQTIQLLKNFGLAGGFLFIAVNGPKEWAVEAKKKYVRL